MKSISEKNLKTLCNLIHYPIFWEDQDGKILGNNKAFENHTFKEFDREKSMSATLTNANNQPIGTVYFLSEPLEMIASALSSSPSNIYWKDREGRYLGANAAELDLVARITGQHFSSIIGKTDHELFDEETADQLRQNDITTIREGKQLTFEEVVILPNGNPLIFISNKAPLYDKDDNIIGIIGSSIEITKQKVLEIELTTAKESAEKARKTTEIYLKSIVSNLPDHVFWEDKNGTFLGCNDQQAKSFGYKSVDQVIGKNIVELGRHVGWGESVINRIKENDAKVMQGSETITLEEEVNWADGSPRTFLSRKAPLRDEKGDCIGMLGLAFDITDRKIMEENLREAKEKAEAANIAKSNFIANISHDLRTPLHTILGTTELLQVREHPREQDELIEGILNAGQNLLKLIENILSFSELESSNHALASDRFDLRHVVESIVVDHTTQAEEKNIDLIISYSDFVPHYVVGHLQNIRRIINNLLENAIKFTDKGYVMVAVECLHAEGDRATLQINVEDTGIGISKTDLDHIFERFYRATPSYTNRYKGTGLGLAIIKQLTENLGGTLQVHSQLEYGTTFSCTIPFKLTESLADEAILKQQLHNARILIIDDHRPRRQALLKQFPGQNVTAVNSKNAFATFEAAEKIQEQFNLIIIDEDIKPTSPEALARLLLDKSSLLQPPILVLCRKINGVKATDEQKELFLQILKKPLAPSELASRIVPTWQRWLAAYQRKTRKPLANKLNVLLVEDDKLIQKFTTSLLLDSGCVVDTASSGKEALEKAKNNYDLVLMDIGLPDIDGLTATQEYRKLVKQHNKKPIIVALTAHVSDEDKKRCLDAGLDDFLKKPATYNDFQMLLEKFFKAEHE